MPRKIVVRTEDGSSPVLVETLAEDELQLQELVKNNPDLLPIEEFGMTGPMLVVGRETSLPSGAVDLLGVARGGEVLVVEFKTGPQNSDFRHALSQVVDYGADMWRMSYPEFERAVVTRYLASDRCHDERLRGLASLKEAAERFWIDLSDEEMSRLQDNVAHQLEDGSFHYVIVAQRFTPTIEGTIEYLNAMTKAARFYAVELVRFTGDGLSAFESRTVIKPPADPRRAPTLDQEEFLERLHDEEYRGVISKLFDASRGLGLRFYFGSAGVSIRVPTSDMAEPLTIAWIFPPGQSGWMGLRDLTLGVDPWSAEKRPSAKDALDRYLEGLKDMEGADAESLGGGVSGVHVAPEVAVQLTDRITELLADLVERINQDS